MTEPTAGQDLPHHRLTVNRQLGALRLRADLPLHAAWTLIFGPSGSGKSSFLRAACGLLGPEGVRFVRRGATGSDELLIAPERATPPHRLGLGYAPQQGALFPHLSVAENVGFTRLAQGEPVRDAADELLEMFEIASLRARRPRTLSGGERQRVNLARAFAVPRARLLLLDEPFSGMGRELRDRLLQRMLAWTEARRLPVLSVSHDVDEALLLGAEVVVLDAGEVVRRGPARVALAAERLRLLQALHPGSAG